MNTKEVVHLATELKMPAFKDHYQLLKQSPDYNRMAHDEIIFHLLEAELVYKKRRSFETKLKASRIKYTSASIETLTFDNRRNLDRNVVLPLALCEWVEHHQNIIATGPTGVGKTHVACGAGVDAIKNGYRVIFKRLPTLLDELSVARSEGLLLKYLTKIAKFRILIIDDFGLSRLKTQERRDLLEIVEEKSGKGSIIITSQMPVEQWHEYLGADAIADAILDRLIHKAHIIDIQGESMRRQQN